VNQIRIRDSRDDGDVHPNDFQSTAVSFDFTDDITGSTNNWDSVMTMKGWGDNYRTWQIFSSAASGSQSVDTVPLFFRSGEEDVQDGWGVTKEILTFPGTAPRVDGSNGQVLQTNGSGVLSWATLPTPITGQYEKYILQQNVSAPSNLPVLLQFTPGDLFGTYQTGAITEWAEGPDYIEIQGDGLYQFNLTASIQFTGPGDIIRLQISTNPFMSGDLFSAENTARSYDFGTVSGVTTAFLTAGTRVYFSVRATGSTYEVGGFIPGPQGRHKVQTFLDIRRLE
jgi:hypothetical protein